MSIDHDALSIALVVVSIALAGTAAWLACDFLRTFADRAQAETTAPTPRWLLVAGLIAFLNGMLLIHFFPPIAFVMAGLILMICLSIQRAAWPANDQKRAYLAVSLLSLAWLTYGIYELRLDQWKETVSGAPIRADLILSAPIFYYSLVKTLAIFRLSLNKAKIQ